MRIKEMKIRYGELEGRFGDPGIGGFEDDELGLIVGKEGLNKD